MRGAELLVTAFDNIRGVVHTAVADLDDAELTWRADPRANTVAWLVWHLSRVQDDHVAAVAGTEQVWLAAGFAERAGLPFEPTATGYGQPPEAVASVRLSADELTGYHDAVHRATVGWVAGLADADLDRVVDERYDPPVTLGVRLVSIVTDDLQHAGQAALLRGVLVRRRGGG